ncbi:MAG: M23 family metallopeptidase [Cyclobacteriaceae bacterium]
MAEEYKESIEIEVKAGQSVVLDLIAKKKDSIPPTVELSNKGALRVLLSDSSSQFDHTDRTIFLKSGNKILNEKVVEGKVEFRELEPGIYEISALDFSSQPESKSIKKVSVSKGTLINVPLQIVDNEIVKTGVYTRKNNLGWSRMYMHLWKQAEKEGKTELNTRELWVLQTCDIISHGFRKLTRSKNEEDKAKALTLRVTPSVISYEDMVAIISTRQPYWLKKKFIPFDKDLKDFKHEDNWFYQHNKYKQYFPAPDGISKEVFDGWWKDADNTEIEDGFLEEKYEEVPIGAPPPPDPDPIVEEEQEDLVGQAEPAPPSPVALYPINNEEIRINRPYLNISNISETGTKTYDFQVSSSDTEFENNLITELTGVQEISENGITYAQITQSLDALDNNSTPPVTGIYFWRARAVLNGQAGLYCTPQQITIKNIWSVHGNSWHFPLDNAATPVTGTFMEGYFHHAVHMGTDFGSNLEPVRSVRNGILKSKNTSAGTVALKHERVPQNDLPDFLSGAGPCTLISEGRHMDRLTGLRVGVMINQGTQVGRSDSTPPGTPPHLHFDLYSPDNEFYNPQKFNYQGYTLPTDDNITIEGIYLRAESYLNHNTRSNFSEKCLIIAQVTDRNRNYPNRPVLAPYRVRFSINHPSLTGDSTVRDIRFDTFLPGVHQDSDFFAYQNQSQKSTQYMLVGRSNAALNINRDLSFLLYCNWSTINYRRNTSARNIYQIEVNAEDVFGNSAETKQYDIGVELRLENKENNIIQLAVINHNSTNIRLHSTSGDNHTHYSNETYDINVINILSDQGPIENLIGLINVDENIQVQNGEMGILEITLETANISEFTITATSNLVTDIFAQLRVII